MDIRECQIEDYERIYEINKNGLGYDYPLDKTKIRLAEILEQPANKLYVVCVEGVVVGYIHGSDYECTYSDPLKNIMAIAVDEAFRGIGAGRLLLEAIEQWARDCDCDGVRLVSGHNRINAHGFYMNCGYTMRKEQKNFIKIFE